MSKQNYHITITAEVPLNDAFDAITKRIQDWWSLDYNGKAENINDDFTVTFGDTFTTMRIIEAIPQQKIVWEVIDSCLPWLKDKLEWQHTKIVWEFTHTNVMTTIHMTHIGLQPQVECYANCEKGWNFYVGESLRKLLTENKGMPSTPRPLR